MNNTCPSCNSSDVRVFHEQRSIPVNSCLLLNDRAEARDFPRGDLVLGFCRSCGFIYNTAFDPALSEYSERYEETQGFSPRFREFAKELAGRWVDKYDLHDKHVVEIGCGKGEFLVLMCELGDNRGTGIDPSYHAERLTTEAASRMKFIVDFYSETYKDLSGDAIVCRHTLEHIQSTHAFVEIIRKSLEDNRDSIVLFELPDVLRVLKDIAFWDLYYEHCSYFTLGSLSRLFRRAQFDVLDLSVEYDDQYLLLESRAGTGTGTPALPAEDDLAIVEAAVTEFETNYPARIAEWQDDIRSIVDAGSKVVLWGGGSKGVAYLTTLGLEQEIQYVVDVNPYKQGKFMAGTGQEVVAPEFLEEYRPDVVIAMNSVYRNEIQSSLDDMHVEATLRAV